MEFLTSDWFMWVIVIVFIGSFLSIFEEFFDDFLNIFEEFFDSSFFSWSGIGYIIKKVFIFIISMIFLPFIIIFTPITEKKEQK